MSVLSGGYRTVTLGKKGCETSLVVWGLRLWAPEAGGGVPGHGTGPHKPQPRVHGPQLKLQIPRAAAKTRPTQRNKPRCKNSLSGGKALRRTVRKRVWSKCLACNKHLLKRKGVVIDSLSLSPPDPDS